MSSASIIIALIIVALPFLLAFALYGFWKERHEKRALAARFKDVISAEDEVRRLEKTAGDLKLNITELQNDYKTKRSTYNLLIKEIAIFDEKFICGNGRL